MSTLDKHMLKELLLVCSALGSVETNGIDGNHAEEDEMDDGLAPPSQQRFVRGENCLEWLQDLQRALRRDDDNTREICITISSWRVVQQKLVPLILECRDDAVLVKTLLKIYVMLTMPISKAAKEALLKPVNPKAEGDVRDQDRRRRENALAQQASLHAFKRAFISKDVLSVIVGMLEEPLNHIGVTRTEDDNFSIELCLTLLRNVLNIKDPTPGMVTSLGDHYVQMHEQVVELMQDALLLDILLLLAQDVHARENAKLNLLLVEIFHCVIRDQEPGAVIAVHRAKVQKGAIGKGSHVRPSSAPNPKGSLLGVLAKEKTMRGNVSGQMHSRHTRFGGTLKIGGESGTTGRIIANPFKDRVDSVPQAARKKTKTANAFTPEDGSGSSHPYSESRKAILAREALYDFSCSFLKTAYDPFMRSIKNEFRIDSSRLQPEDKGMMFRLMSFFMSFHHQLHKAAVTDAVEAGRKGADLPKFELGHVLETMDLMSFNLVLREAEAAISEKAPKRLVECVAVLKEMMHIVTMLNESSEKAHQLVALGLLARVFYASEPLDNLHSIVRDWQPGKYSKRFLCHLVELIHTTLKTLEWYKKSKSRYFGDDATGEGVNGAFDKDIQDKVNAAKAFELDRYFHRLVNNRTVRMYSTLLEHYATNSARTNHYILSFMMRLSNFTGKESSSKKRRGESTAQGGARLNDGLGLEAMLYNVHTLGVFQKVLDDPLSRQSALKHLVHYVQSAVRHFGTLARKNRLVFVEALFQHPNPQGFCGALHNVYCDSVDANGEDYEDYEPKRKKAKKKASSDNESDNDDSDGDGDGDNENGARANSGVVARDDQQLSAADDTDEDEWDENAPEKASDGPSDEEGEGVEANGARGKKNKKARKTERHRGRKEDGNPGSKKRAPRWTKAEDAYLREQYPIYADSNSIFAVLKMGDALEANDRTEDQIKRRVKKLGLKSSTEEEDLSADGESDADKEQEPPLPSLSSDEGLDKDRNEKGDSGSSVEGHKSTGSPVPLHKILRKSQAQSDDDDEGMFSSPEDNGLEGGEGAATTTATHRPNKRAVLEDSDDE